MFESRNSAINPFETALKQLDEAAKLINLDKGLHEVLAHPKRVLTIADIPYGGKDYVFLNLGCVAVQVVTGQTAMLQFVQAGPKHVALPTIVHCEHLIQARVDSAAFPSGLMIGTDSHTPNKGELDAAEVMAGMNGNLLHTKHFDICLKDKMDQSTSLKNIVEEEN